MTELQISACRTFIWLALMLVAPSLSASTFSFPPVSQGSVTAPAITEASGLVASPNNANVMWLHNDSGDTNRIFAIDTSGHLLGTYTLPGATNNDWEAMAVGPGPEPGVNYIYVASSANGTSSVVVRIPEPTVYAAQQVGSPVTKSLTGVQSQTFNWPAPDAEAMFLDPANGDIYLGSKESSGITGTNFYRGTQAQFGAAGVQNLSFVANVAVARGNGADISPDGSEIFVRNQNQNAFLYHRAPGQTIAQALASAPDFVSVHGKDVEPNAEAIAFDSNGVNFYTFSEGSNQKLYLYTRTSDDAPAVPTSLVAAAAEWKYLDGGAVPAAGWNQPGFDDSSWSAGSGPFGYGQGSEQTLLSFGGNPSAKPASYQFRTTFDLNDGFSVADLTLKLLVDDGAAVYLNGVEIVRFNLAAGAGLGDYAVGSVADALQNTWRSFAVDPSLLHGGVNTLAIEVHGASMTDADLRFDAQLTGIVSELQAGDFDGDGDVDGADFVVWQTHFPSAGGATWSTGDADGDGDVDGADFVVWQTNFPTSGSPATSPVPEPGGAVLLLIGLAVATKAFGPRSNFKTFSQRPNQTLT